MKNRALIAIKDLFLTLNRKYNKVYMRDLEGVFKKMESLELTPAEIQALEYLRRDLQG